MRKNRNSTAITVQSHPADVRWSLAASLFRFAASVLLCFGLCGSIYAATRGCTANVVVAACVMALVCAAVTFLPGTRLQGFGSVLVLAAMGVCVAIFFRPVITGFSGLINSFSDAVTANTGKILLDIAAGGNPVASQTLAASLFSGVIALLLGLLVNSMCACLILLPALAMAALYVTGYLAPGVWLLVFAAGALLFLLLAAQTGGNMAFDKKTLLAVTAVSLVFATLTGAVGCLLNPPGTEKIRRDLTYGVQNLLYGGRANSMPHGRLDDVDPWKPDATTALEITVGKPQKLYLRGFVGESYTGASWEHLPCEQMLDASDTFYWLHQNGFYGQTQIAQAVDVAKKQESHEISVKNVAAYREYAYLPYALADNSLLDAALIGDAGTAAESGNYQARYLAGSVPEWYVAQTELAALQEENDETALAYLGAEQVYAEFARANYLGLTDEAVAVLNQKLTKPDGGMTLLEIKEVATELLDEYMRYSTYAHTKTKNMDFLEYVLGYSGNGYSVHYATIAALVLRYYGVPSRYVEGYYISTGEADGWTAGEAMTVDETHAHAWAEYYLDGVGWIPLEVTPGYIDEEEIILNNLIQDENSPFSQGAGRVYTQEHLQDVKPKPEVIHPETSTLENNDRNNFRFEGVFAWYILVVLLLVMILILAIKRVQIHRKLMRMQAERDNNEAVALLFGYASRLMSCAGMQESAGGLQELRTSVANWHSAATDCDEICDLNEEAMFSSHKLTSAQRAQMQNYVISTLRQCKARWGIPKRLYYKWIKCIY